MYKRLIIVSVIIFSALAAFAILGFHSISLHADGLAGKRIIAFTDVAEQIRLDVNQKLDKFIQTEQKRPYTDYQYFYTPETVNKTFNGDGNPILRSPLAKSMSHGMAYGHFQVEPNGKIVSPFYVEGQSQELDIEKLSYISILNDNITNSLNERAEVTELLKLNRKELTKKTPVKKTIAGPIAKTSGNTQNLTKSKSQKKRNPKTQRQYAKNIYGNNYMVDSFQEERNQQSLTFRQSRSIVNANFAGNQSQSGGAIYTQNGQPTQQVAVMDAEQGTQMRTTGQGVRLNIQTPQRRATTVSRNQRGGYSIRRPTTQQDELIGLRRKAKEAKRNVEIEKADIEIAAKPAVLSESNTRAAKAIADISAPEMNAPQKAMRRLNQRKARSGGIAKDEKRYEKYTEAEESEKKDMQQIEFDAPGKKKFASVDNLTADALNNSIAITATDKSLEVVNQTSGGNAGTGGSFSYQQTQQKVGDEAFEALQDWQILDGKAQIARETTGQTILIDADSQLQQDDFTTQIDTSAPQMDNLTAAYKQTLQKALHNALGIVQTQQIEDDMVQIRIEPFVPLKVEAGTDKNSLFGNQIFLLRHVQIGDNHLLQGFRLNETELLAQIRQSATRLLRSDMGFELSKYESPDAMHAAVLDFGFGTIVLNLMELKPQWIAKQVSQLKNWYFAIVTIVLIATLVAMASLWRSLNAQVKLARKKDDFISAVSHELRTPLTTIRMYTEMLEKNWVKTDDKRTEYYSTMRQESERLTRLIENVLDFSRIQRGKKRYNFALGDINSCVNEVVEMMAPCAANQNFRIETELSTDIQSTSFDNDAVMQIVINLIDNALKYAANADDKTITVRTRTEGKYVLIEVADHGPGIPHTQRKKVFDEFYRIAEESKRETTGTGLGLALVKKIAQAHNGFVEAISAKPNGALLRVALASTTT